MRLMVSSEQLKKDANLIKEAKKNLHRAGVTRDGKHYDLSIYLMGPIHLTKRPVDCKLKDISFPMDYFTVHVSYGQDQNPVINETKYYCRTYNAARNLAEKMKEDKGIEIIEIISKSDSNEEEPSDGGNYSNFRSTEKYNGYNGFDDRTIDDAFEGDPEMTWNVD